MENLVECLLKNRYGEVVSSTGVFLLKNPGCFKGEIYKELGDDADSVLSLLLEVNYISITSADLCYLHCENVLASIRHSKYLRLFQVKFLDTEISERIIENGSVSLSKFNSDLMQDMIFSNYLITTHDFHLKLLQNIVANTKHSRKRPKIDLDVNIDPDLYTLNIEFLDRLLLSEIIGKYISDRLSLESAVLAETIYKLTLISQEELYLNLPQRPTFTALSFTESLDLLASSTLTQEIPLNKLQLNIPYIRSQLTEMIITKMIKGNFTEQHSRIYIVLRSQVLLDEERISDLALIPSACVKSYLLDLTSSHFILTKGGCYTYNPVPPLPDSLYSRIQFLIENHPQALELTSSILEIDKTLLITTKLL